ncbi:S8 family serine peptidase [Sphingomonas sp.]|uniref:S8 family serine peptidase n=1 Tax=Sphingomonas sp. TaxID=28214 RepID=UPI003B006B9D
MTVKGLAWRGASLGALSALAACGGGGVASTPAPPVVVAPTPTPAPVPTPTPTPAPAPAPAASNDTSEYRATVGAVNLNALAAYNVGATGSGVGIAIIDSGIDLDSPEFDNRISSASQALAGNTTVDDEGGHGTAVAFTAAGRRNGTGTHGVAFGATVIALRADRPGTCATAATDDEDSGCRFSSDALTQGVDAARAAGARVINMSLGGSTMPATLQAAIGRATAAGIVVVIAAGNDGTDNPDQFTEVGGTANANNAVIVAGSIGAGNTISSFSDKAGTGAAYYLTAIGERVRAPDETNTPYLWSGTSFAAPQISGAVALLAQAFPNLTGAQIVNLLLTTARDAGAAGTDPIYGRGILDLTRAFQPVGTAMVAGAAAQVTATAGQTSAAMGDASPAGVGAVILDGYDRAFAIDLAGTLSRAPATRPLDAALRARTIASSFAVGGTSVAMTLAPTRTGATLAQTSLTGHDAEAARAIAGSIVQRLGSRTSFALGFSQGAGGLTAQLAGNSEPAFLVAGPTGGIDTAPASSVAVRHSLGGWGVTAAAETGGVLSPRERLLPGSRYWQRTPYDRVAFGLDRAVGPVVAHAGVTRLHEDATVLGARFGAALGSPGATSWFAETGAQVEAGGWTLGGSWRQGQTAAQVHGFAGGGTLRTTSWSADLGKAGLFGGDRLDLRAAQPLRVASGGIDLTLPTGWDYAADAVSAWTTQRLGLAPQGRELDVEALYTVPLSRGALRTNLYWRRDPGNVAALGPDYGAAVRWSVGW